MSTEPEPEPTAATKSNTITKTILKFAGLSLFLVVLLAMILPAFSAKRKAGRRWNCKGNLKQIGLALTIYANEDKATGSFPDGDSFERLNQTGHLVNGKIYTCPSCDKPNTLASESNYVYVGAGFTLDHSDHAKIILAHDRLGNHENWINCLYADGHTKGHKTKAQTRAQLKAEREAAGDIISTP